MYRTAQEAVPGQAATPTRSPTRLKPVSLTVPNSPFHRADCPTRIGEGPADPQFLWQSGAKLTGRSKFWNDFHSKEAEKGLLWIMCP